MKIFHCQTDNQHEKKSSGLILRILPLHVALFFSVLVIAPSLVNAKTLKLIDQFGLPLSDAIIALALPNNTQSIAAQTPAIMDQIDKQFVPKVLVIQQGERVSFPNSDDIRHHVYSFSAPKPFEIKLFKGQVTDPILFDRAGIVVLGCNIHDQMIGYIYVADHEQTYISNEAGEVTLPDDTNELTLWHPNLSTNNSLRTSIQLATISPLPNGDVQAIEVQLVTQQHEFNTQQEQSSKFKKKFNR